MSSTTTLDVAQHFTPGTSVTVHVRHSDYFNAPAPVKTAKVPDDGNLKLTGLEPHADYWLEAEGRTGYPVDPDEILPQPGKEHVKDVPQRDGAETGYATPVDPNEVQPGLKYEDETSPQRVGADTGTAVPVAQGNPVDQAQAEDASVSKAQGATVPVKGTDKVAPRKRTQSRPAAKKTTKAVKDPVKPAAKKATRKGD